MSDPKPPLTLTLPPHPRYAVVEKIAQGDYATVFRGRDNELNREVAIKQIHAQYLEDPHQLDRYWQEARLIANLEHPRILTIYDIVRDRGWLILELMMGSMQQILKGRPIDLTDLRYLIKAVALGLQFLERNGIIHGDVKPSNLLVDKNRQVRLGDFGIARRLAGSEGSVVKSTAKYMAPEVVSDQFGEVGPHSDLYSLGFTAYELMCGQNFDSLFPGLNMFGRDRQIAWMMWQSAPDRRLPEIRRVLQNVPDDLTHVIEKLCEKDPAKRYRTAEEVLQDLGDDRPRAKPPTSQEVADADKAAKQARRKRLLAVGGLAVSLLLCVGLAFLPSAPSGTNGPTQTRPIDKPLHGKLVLIDLQKPRLQIETDDGTLTTVPINPQGDRFFLNKEVSRVEQLREGDRISVEPLVVDGKVVRTEFWIERATAVETRGLIASVEATSRKITITPDGAPQNLPEVFVPSTVPILLNGATVGLEALQKGDRVIAKYVPDKDGPKAESLDAQRLMELKGLIEAIRLPSHVTVRQPDSTLRELLVDEACQILVNGRPADAEGHVFALANLRKNDEVTLQHDRTVHRITASRELIVHGTVEKADAQRRVLDVRQDNSALRSLALAEDCAVYLADNEPVDFASLRIGDAVRVVEDSQDGRARRIDAVFAPDRRVWAIVVVQAKYDDGRLTPSATAQPGAELIRQTLLRHARVVQEQLLWRPDATRFGVQNATAEFLQRVPAESRLIVYYAGHATKTDQGEVYLAPRDFDPSRPRETGLDLAAFLDGLDAAPASEKAFLFDVQRGGEDRRWQPAAAELIEALKARRSRITHTVHVIANCSKGEADATAEGGRTGVFARSAATALMGKADFDRNQQVTPGEIFRYLKIEVATCALRAGQEQNPVLFEPMPEARLGAEAVAAIRSLLQTAREGRKADDAFWLACQKAAALSPNQPDAHLIGALVTLKDKLRSKLAQDRFQQVTANFSDNPRSVLAYHALAWLNFRSQNYDRGLECLEQAVSRVSDPNRPYDKHLLESAGQLSAFARWAVDDPKLYPKLSQVLETVKGKGGEGPYRAALEGVHGIVKDRKQAIEQESDSAKKAVLELQLKNVNSYADFDFSYAWTYLEESLAALK